MILSKLTLKYITSKWNQFRNENQNDIFPTRYDPEVLINEGVEYAELYIRGTAREPPDFVVSEVE